MWFSALAIAAIYIFGLWWRKIIFRMRSGPEDWRLAYISFALLAA